MSQKLHDLLLLVGCMAACSVFYYLGARVFIRVVGFMGRKTKGSLALRIVSYFAVWLLTVAAILTPFFLVGTSLRRSAGLAWTMLLVLLFFASLLPAARHIRKNMEVLYEAGYAKRR